MSQDPYQRAAIGQFLTVSYWALSSKRIAAYGRLGDRAAISCLLLTRDDRLWSDRNYANRVLDLIQCAFDVPSQIDSRDARLPIVSIEILERYLTRIEDLEVATRATGLLVALKQILEAEVLKLEGT